MPIQNIIVDDSAITVVGTGGEFIYVSASDIVYGEVRRYLTEERGTDLARIQEIITGTREGVEELIDAAESAVDGDTDGAYRVKHGDPVEDVVFDTAVKLNREGGNASAIVKFLERLERNPSAASRSQLFAWLKAGGFSITSDGLVVGFKAVTSDGFSISQGREPVTVKTADGVSEVITGRIPYPVGATVSIPRELVDDNRNAACSVGLHVGTLSYAQGFGGYDSPILVVLFDPAHVVSVPKDSSDQKVRVEKLFVAALLEEDDISDTIVTVFDEAAAREYASRPENEKPVPEWDDSDDDSWDDESDEWDEDPDDDEDSEDESELADWEKELLSEAEQEGSDFDAADSNDEDAEESLSPEVVSVRVSVVAKVSDAPMKKRDLGKRFSKKRREFLSAALESLVADGTLSVDDDGVYNIGVHNIG